MLFLDLVYYYCLVSVVSLSPFTHDTYNFVKTFFLYLGLLHPFLTGYSFIIAIFHTSMDPTHVEQLCYNRNDALKIE